MFCSKCGAQNEDNADFCSNCGSSLKLSQPEVNTQAGVYEKLEIKSPSYGRIGLALAFVALVGVGITYGSFFYYALFGIFMSIITSIPAIVLGKKALNELNRKYRDIAMQNVVYRDEFNAAKGNMMLAFWGGIMGLVLAVFALIIIV